MKKLKNVLVAYHGGGYDGCFWEVNYTLIDKQCKFHDLYSSGYAGCDTREKLNKVLDDEHTYIYKLTKKGYKDFTENSNAGHVIGITKILNNDHGYNLTWACDTCGDEVSYGASEGYEDAGGLVIQATEKICEDCYSSYSCPNCGYVGEEVKIYYDEDEVEGVGEVVSVNIDGCEYCLEEDDIEQYERDRKCIDKIREGLKDQLKLDLAYEGA